MVDKNFCMSSYLSFRYVVDDDKDFYPNLRHQLYHQKPTSEHTLVRTVKEVDDAIYNVMCLVRNEKLGLLLSGGMDSACLAAYMPKGSDAYTFRFEGGTFQGDELRRAEYYADQYHLNLHYVDISWPIVDDAVDVVMAAKGAPVHSIEPQLYYAAQCAKSDGVSMLVIGDGADYVFGGMDGLLSKDWSYSGYVDRVTYVNPAVVLKNPVSMDPIFERYRIGPNSIDYMRFYNEIVTDESYASYLNALHAAGMAYVDPYENLKMACPLDLRRNRSGDSKYLMRELFRMKYPNCKVPEKLPMPRPVDAYFKCWSGVSRSEFLTNIDYTKLSGNQKWLLYCLERFLNNNEPQ